MLEEGTINQGQSAWTIVVFLLYKQEEDQQTDPLSVCLSGVILQTSLRSHTGGCNTYNTPDSAVPSHLVHLFSYLSPFYLVAIVMYLTNVTLYILM